MSQFIRSRCSPVAAWRCTILIGAITLAGCASAPVPPPPAITTVPVPDANFVIAADALDTWNAIGQILTHADGVTYRGRAQMMGLYDVEYRGERLLLVSHGIVLDDRVTTPTTQVRVAGGDGKPDVSPTAIDLLRLVQTALPFELQRIAQLPPSPPSKKKPKRR